MLLARICVAAIYTQHRWQNVLTRFIFRFSSGFRVLIRSYSTAPDDHMPGGISSRANNTCDAILVNPEKAVRGASRLHCVERNLQAAVGTVLEPDRHGQPACHFTVRL